MYLFWRLYLSHLIADFPLQTDAVFKIKVTRPWGVILHGSIAGILGIVFGLPFVFKYPILLLWLIALWIFHILLDKVKLVITPKVKPLGFVFFFLDQVFHFLSIYFVATRIPMDAVAGDWIPLYNDTVFVQVLSVLLLLTYGILFFTPSIRGSLGWEFKFAKGWARIWEFGERIIITVGMVLGSWALILIPLAVLPRVFLVVRGKDWKGFLECGVNIVSGVIAGWFIAGWVCPHWRI